MALIYIVEDDENIREIEEYALKNAGYQTQGFSSAKEFYQRIEEMLPDLCILDVMLPDQSGNEIVRKLRKYPETRERPVIMVTAKTSDVDLVRGFEDGADDYIKKPFSIIELISRVKSLLRRTKKETSKELKLDELLINNERHEVLLGGQILELTFKEYELLSLLVLNRGIVLGRDVIMDRVWGTDYEGESRTIDMHIKTLRKKLGDFGKRIKTKRNVGYVLE